jgi:ATP-dependent exoDNAse (exonuclease V) beta subunit
VMQCLQLTPYRTEWKIYSDVLCEAKPDGKSYQICGMIDCIVQSKDGKFHMFDWKRSKKIDKFGYRTRGLGVCSHVSDCNFSHYTIQLNLYKYILETYYHVAIASMAIVVLHPQKRTFELHNIPCCPSLIQTMLEQPYSDASNEVV